MATEIVVVSDTHCHEWTEVHPEIKEAVAAADIAVHCGDVVRTDVVEGFRESAKLAVVVHGNSDPPELRSAIPAVELIEIEGRRIGVTHPAWGGPEFPLQELLPDFESMGGVDTVLFGHIHETVDEIAGGVRFINPGQGYESFMVPGTFAVLRVEGCNIEVEFRTVTPRKTRRS